MKALPELLRRSRYARLTKLRRRQNESGRRPLDLVGGASVCLHIGFEEGAWLARKGYAREEHHRTHRQGRRCHRPGVECYDQSRLNLKLSPAWAASSKRPRRPSIG